MAVSAIQDVRTRSSAKPTVAELIERARTIGIVAREKALETEQRRHVSAELIGMMRDAELFRLMQPERFGGFEYGYDVFVELVAAIGCRRWFDRLGLQSWRGSSLADRLLPRRGAERNMEPGSRRDSRGLVCTGRQGSAGQGWLSSDRPFQFCERRRQRQLGDCRRHVASQRRPEAGLLSRPAFTILNPR